MHDEHKAVVGGPAGPAFLAENGFGRTTIFDYSAENMLAVYQMRRNHTVTLPFLLFFKRGDPI